MADESIARRAKRLAPFLKVARPSAWGRTPVVFLLHGCGGPRPFIDDIARVIANAGATAVAIDSYAPRHISRIEAFATVCTGLRFHGRERAGDLFAALHWARGQEWADARKFAAVGWSHGSWTIMDALAFRSTQEMERATGLADLPSEPLEGLAATLLVYPYANVGSWAGRRDWRLAPTSTAIIAGADYIVGDTRAVLRRQRARSPSLDLVVFEGATHAFEDRHAEDPRVRYNPAATAREHDMLRAMVAALR